MYACAFLSFPHFFGCCKNVATKLIWNQCYKTFYIRNLRIFIISWSVYTGKFVQPSIIFVSKTRAYPRRVPFSCSILGSGPCLTHKHWIRLERLARDKHSSLLRNFVDYWRKNLTTLGAEGWKGFRAFPLIEFDPCSQKNLKIGANNFLFNWKFKMFFMKL
jgi:hypothetical protein